MITTYQAVSQTLDDTNQCVKILLHRFWKQWRTECLLQLREYHKEKKMGTIVPAVGDVVLVRND